MTENNVAAQAGDEPMLLPMTVADAMRIVRANGPYTQDIERAFAANVDQVSPRATADVERNKVLEEIAQHFDAKVLRCNPAYVSEFVRDLKSVATTKPGA